MYPSHVLTITLMLMFGVLTTFATASALQQWATRYQHAGDIVMIEEARMPAAFGRATSPALGR